MSFYRTLLEGDVNVLDNDNDGSEMAKKLMKEIDDQEINIDEVESAADAEFEPGEGVDDIMDEMYMAIAEAEMDWNAMMQEAGLMELSEAARGIVTEGKMDSVKDFFNKTKEKIKEFFNKVWQVIQRWASNLTAVVATNKKLASKYADKIKSGYEKYKSDSSIDRIEGYTFSGVEEAFNKFKAKAEVKYAEGEDGGREILRSLRKEYAGSEDSSDFRSNMMEKLRGSKDTVKLSISGEEVIKMLKEDEVTKKKVREAMNQSKKEFKSAIKKVDELQKKAEKAAGSKDAAEKAEGKANYAKYTVQATNIREQLKILQIVRSCLLSAIGAKAKQARKVANAYIRLGNKEKYKGFQNESYGFLSGLNLI